MNNFEFIKEYNLSENKHFENFFVASNQKLVEHAKKFSAGDTKNINNQLYIIGESGLGKTHLLNAIGNHYALLFPANSILYIDGYSFYFEYIKAVNRKLSVEFIDFFSSVDFLLIDDIDCIQEEPEAIKAFEQIIETRKLNNKKIVMSSFIVPSLLTDFNANLIAELLNSQIIYIDEFTQTDVTFFIKILCEQYNYTISEDAIDFIKDWSSVNPNKIRGTLFLFFEEANKNDRKIDINTCFETMINKNT